MLTAAAFVASASLSIQALSPKEKGLQSINKATAEAHLDFLASDELRGREAGYESGRIAGRYVESYLRTLGLEPWNGESFIQPFEAYRIERQRKGRYEVHPDSIAQICKGVHQKLNLKNVMARIEGKNPDEIVIIGAHYDHLGVDPLLDGDQIYNGADDNASGVQAVLQIARAFVESGQQPERTVIFALWDGEEKGLLGSKHFVLTFPELPKVKAYLNFDMIGRNNKPDNPEHVVYFYTAAYPTFEKWLRDDIERYKLRIDPDYRAWDRPVGGGDQGSFALHDIPIIWYHTDWHPDYHMPSDHSELLNWDKMLEITRAAFLNFWNMANEKSF